MTPMARRLVARAVAAATPLIPKGAQEVMVGDHFRVLYGPAQAEALKDLQDKLPRVAALYASRGFPLRGKVSVVPRKLGPARAAGRYFPTYRLVEVDPRYMTGDQISTTIHELAHWQHDQAVQGGWGNFDIRDMYHKAMQKDTKAPPRTPTHDLVDQVQALRSQMAQLQAQNEEVKAKKGDAFQVIWNNKPTRFVVLKVTRKDVVVQATPDGGAPRQETLDPEGFVYAVDPQGYMERGKEFRRLEAEANDLARKPPEKVTTKEDYYGFMQNDWMPTDYAKTDHKEWFAEMITTAIMHPAALKAEVTKWLKEMW